MKRNYNPYIQNKKPTPSSSSDSLARIKAKLAEKNAAKATADATSSKGLDVEIHPLLRTSIPISNLQTSKNPLRANAKRQFDPTSLNPYLDQSATTIKPRTHKPLAFNEHGKYISQGNKMREKLSRDLLEEEKLARFRRDGLAANEDLGEQLYKPTMPPAVEWWDRPYLKTSHYSDNFVLDSEDAPITEYVQHPSFVPAPWERHLPQQPQPLKLTKQEMKKIRRNDRLEKHKDKQDRIKLGLDEPPAPKVKLLNLMNVLTNEAIQDPTALEMRVRQEVEERFNKHMEENESRKLTSEEKHAKQHLQNIKQLEQGYYTSVYKINTLLGNPKNFYKLDVNAKQLELVGICLINPKFNLVVVQGGLKNINFYHKLMTSRINWKEYIKPKLDDTSIQSEDDQPVDLSKNECKVIWQGQVKEITFQKWSIMRSRNDDEAFQVLHRFKIENYWRQAAIDAS